MNEIFIITLVVLFVFAAFTRETFVIIIVYLLVGSFLLSLWWSRIVVQKLSVKRKFNNKAFPDEIVPMELVLTNQSWLPAVWMHLQDLFPLELADIRTFHEVVSLAPRQKISLSYKLKAHKRGLYQVGPFEVRTGDLLGLTAEITSHGLIENLTVYPTVIPLTNPFLPSRSPMGTLHHTQPLFEDPSRSGGKREYTAGDSLRRIDWKASASAGRLQVKLFEPSIALETMIFLNLNLNEFHPKSRYDGSELAIVVAASLASWAIGKRQSAGLATNGLDPLSSDGLSLPMLPRKGRAHLMRYLELLARIKAQETESLARLIGRTRPQLSWGTTVVMVTGATDQALFDEIIQTKRSGLNPVLILCGRHADVEETRKKAKITGVVLYEFRSEEDLRIWQR